MSMGSICSNLLRPTLDTKHPNLRQYGARYALILFCIINILNFSDRIIPSAVKPLFQEELGLTDLEASLPFTATLIVFMIFAIAFGVIVDRGFMDRRLVVFIGVLLWSAATSLASLSKDLATLLVTRSMVGVGEAAYGIVVPPMLFDFYPQHERLTALSVFYVGIPLGMALGFAVGSGIGAAFGWRVAFIAIGIPGFLLAPLFLRLNNPSSGINDNISRTNASNDENIGLEKPSTTLGEIESPFHLISNVSESETSQTQIKNIKSGTNSSNDSIDTPLQAGTNDSINKKSALTLGSETYELFTTPTYVCSVAGLTAVTFAQGGVIDWWVSLLVRSGSELAEAGAVVAVCLVLGGLVGVPLGAKVDNWVMQFHSNSLVQSTESQSLKKRNVRLLAPSIFALFGSAFLLLAVNIPQPIELNAVLLAGFEICLFAVAAPIGSIAYQPLRPELRARAAGVLIFSIHAFGDAISPPIIGALSDSLDSLQQAIQITWAACALGGFIWFVGYYFLKIDSNFESAANDKLTGKHFTAVAMVVGGSASATTVSYFSLLCGSEPLEMKLSGIVQRSTDSTPAEVTNAPL